jgi:hypothetical protein
MSREQELGLDKNRKKFDVREEYFVSTKLPTLPFALYEYKTPLSESSILVPHFFVETKRGEPR